jgi:2-amino-4-hydroxy-6-hydroxymethyldihydropteridine diphosphokinase
MPAERTGYLSLGSNIEPRRSYLEEALRLLATPQVRIVRVSTIMETVPWGGVAQADFLNLVAEIATELEPQALLEFCQQIERRLGRERATAIHWGPRPIDIDILLLGEVVLQSANLTLPHKYMKERAFVLEPLYEIAPALVLPTGESVAELWANIAKG